MPFDSSNRPQYLMAKASEELIPSNTPSKHSKFGDAFGRRASQPGLSLKIPFDPGPLSPVETEEVIRIVRETPIEPIAP